MISTESDQMRESLVTMVYNLLPIGLIATTFNSLLVFFIHWNLVPLQFSIPWVSVLFFTSILRFVIFYFFRYTKDKLANLRLWNTLLIGGIVISGILWGAAALFMVIHNSITHYVLVAFVLGGMCTGASAAYAALRSAYLGFVIPALIPAIIIFLINAEPVSITMAFMLTLYGILIIVSAETNHKMIISTFLLRFEREGLITQLTGEKDEVAKSNTNLRSEITRREALERELLRAHSDLEKKVSDRTAELARANEKLMESNNELSTFTHTVSHDLRAPLRTIDGLVFILQEDYSQIINEQDKKYITMIRSSIKRMNDLIDDLLTLSKVGQTEINRVEVDLSILTAEIMENLKSRDPDRVVDVLIQPLL